MTILTEITILAQAINTMNVFDELKRRNVLKVAVAYLAGAWLLIQVTDTVFPRIGLSDGAVTHVILILAIGFIPALVLAWAFEFTPAGIKRDADADPASPRTNKALDRIIIVVLVLAIGYFSVDKFVLDPARDVEMIEEAADQGRRDALLKSYGDKSIAVLAFDDMSPGQDQEYFADGIAEELLNLLATIRELRVISRSSAFSFKGSGATLPEIADRLDVAYILEGSVRKSGETLRITAQLIDTQTDGHVWSKTYDRKLGDVFAIQDEISTHIVEQLQITLLDDAPSATEIDPRAYEKYLKARYILHSANESQYEQAEALLKEVLAVEPDYVPAISWLAVAYFSMHSLADGGEQQQLMELLLGQMNRVIELEPHGVDALMWQAWHVMYTEGDLQKRATFIEQAFAVDPNNPDVLRMAANVMYQIGRTSESLALSKYLVSRDPACASCVGSLARAYRRAGRHEESASVLENLMLWHAFSSDHYWYLGVSWLVAGHPDKALAAFERQSSENMRKYSRLFALHDLGRIDEFDARFAKRMGDELRSTEGIARIYAWIGDNDNAFKWLDKMVEEDGPDEVSHINTDLYQKIKSDPRWKELREKHGYGDEMIAAIEFDITLPAGVTVE